MEAQRQWIVIPEPLAWHCDFFLQFPPNSSFNSGPVTSGNTVECQTPETSHTYIVNLNQNHCMAEITSGRANVNKDRLYSSL